MPRHCLAGAEEAENVFQAKSKKAFALGLRADGVSLGAEMTAPPKADDVGGGHHGEELLQPSRVAHVHRFQIKTVFLQMTSYLVVDDVWILLGESLIILHFRPVWNVVVEGFGSHNPGIGRFAGKCPSWGIFHPDRPGPQSQNRALNFPKNQFLKPEIIAEVKPAGVFVFDEFV